MSFTSIKTPTEQFNDAVFQHSRASLRYHGLVRTIEGYTDTLTITEPNMNPPLNESNLRWAETAIGFLYAIGDEANINVVVVRLDDEVADD